MKLNKRLVENEANLTIRKETLAIISALSPNDDNCIEEGLILTSLTFGNRYINQSLDVYLKWLLYSKGYFRSSYIFGENKNLTAYDNFKNKFKSDILRLFS